MQKNEVIAYNITDAAIAKMEDLYMGLTIADIENQEEFQAVHDARIVVKNHRISVERKRAELKADSLAWGRKVDGEAKRIKGLLEPIELHLVTEEKKVTDEQKRIKEEEDRLEKLKIQERVNSLFAVNVVLPFFDVACMADEEYELKLDAGKAELERVKREQEYQAEIKRLEEEDLAKKRAEIERIEKEQAEKANIQAEKEKALQAERDAIETQKRVGIEQKRNFREEVLRSIGIYRAGMAGESLASKFEDFVYAGSTLTWNSIIDMLDVDFDKFLKDIKAQLDNFELAKKKDKIAKAIEEARIAAEKAETARLLQEAEAKRIEKEAEAEKERKKALMPDREKLSLFAQAILNIPLPDVNDERAQAICLNAQKRLAEIANNIMNQEEKL